VRKFLRHDPGTGELRLVYTAVWDGYHERTEYRVMNARTGGTVLRGPDAEDHDGRAVHGHAPDLYIRLGPWGERHVPVWTEDAPVAATAKTPCPKTSNARRKCALCEADKAADSLLT